MKPTVELNKEQFLDRIEHELDFNEAAMNMVGKLWDDMEGKSVSLTSREGLDIYYPAFIEDFLQIVDDRMELDEIVELIKEYSNYSEIINKNSRSSERKITENSLFYDYLDGSEACKEGPYRVAEIREWLKEEDELNTENSWRVDRRGGKGIDEFWDACTAQELVEYWLEDRAGVGCRIEFVCDSDNLYEQSLAIEEYAIRLFEEKGYKIQDHDAANFEAVKGNQHIEFYSGDEIAMNFASQQNNEACEIVELINKGMKESLSISTGSQAYAKPTRDAVNDSKSVGKGAVAKSVEKKI